MNTQEVLTELFAILTPTTRSAVFDELVQAQTEGVKDLPKPPYPAEPTPEPLRKHLAVCGVGISAILQVEKEIQELKE